MPVIPLTQALPEEAEASSSSKPGLLLAATAAGVTGVTQIQVDESEPAMKKLRSDPPLESSNFNEHKEVCIATTKFFICTKSADIPTYRVNEHVRSKVPGDKGVELAKNLVRLWQQMGLAIDIGKTAHSKSRLVAPPDSQRDTLADTLGEVLGLSDADKDKVKKVWTQAVSYSKLVLGG